MKTYQAGGPTYKYPANGDEEPSRGAKVIILTIGCIATTGPWDAESCLGWAPLPKRNRQVEDQILAKLSADKTIPTRTNS